MVDELLSQDEIDALLSGPGSSSSAPPSGDLSAEERDVLGEVANIIANAGGNVIGMLAGRMVTATVGETTVFPQGELAARGGRQLLYTMVCDGFDNAPAAMVLPERGALITADLMMGGDGKDLPGEANDLYLSASQEGLSQMVGSAFTSISGLLKGQRLVPSNASGVLKEGGDWLPFGDMSSDVPAWGVRVAVSVADVGDFDLWFLLPVDRARELVARIHAVLAPPAPPKPAPAASKPAAPAPSPASAPRAAAAPPPLAAPAPSRGAPPVDVRPAEFVPLQGDGGTPLPANLDLILDIPVRITVELGRTRKTIGEVLNMAPGSVVELEKMAGEPVDVLVNGKLVARGEVVVIDESFGVRVTEIVSKTERIRSMGM